MSNRPAAAVVDHPHRHVAADSVDVHAHPGRPGRAGATLVTASVSNPMHRHYQRIGRHPVDTRLELQLHRKTVGRRTVNQRRESSPHARRWSLPAVSL